jgi:glucan 1,3-beta-glucosidase
MADGPDRDGPIGAARRLLLLAALGLAAAAALWHGWRMGVPVPIAEPGAERLECVSYAPFRRPGETPFDPTARVDEVRIEADLRLLSSRTGCVRTYSVQQGLDAVPRVARRLGMQVLLGAWIGRDRRENEDELAAVVGLAREYADTVRAVVVGNEVMLRRELPEADLVGYIERVRGAVPVPVTYADVWEFWLQHPSIAPAVSFATIHILPYWEDEPVGIDAAIAHVVDVWRLMGERLQGREILVGETGWPSEGRARRDAVPGRVEQARFARQFTRAAAEHGIRYNFIEAFDQPWKRHLEGAMGGAWGVYDSDGRPKFDWHGPVAPRDGWTAWRTAAAAGALLGVVALGLAGRGRGVAVHALVGALAGAGLGATLAEQVRYMVVWNRTWLEWTATGTATAIAVAACVAAALLLARRLSERGGAVVAAVVPGATTVKAAPRAAPGEALPGASAFDSPAATGTVLPGAADTMDGWLRSGRDPPLAGWTSLLQAAVLFCAATTVVLHGFDARYRGFPWPLFAPAAVAAALLWAAGVRRVRQAVEERWLAAIVLAGAAAMVVKEGPANSQAIGYAALMAVLGACALARASTSRPSSAPTAAGS